MASSQVIPVRLSERELADLDRVRGTTPRSTWIKSLVAAAVVARDAFGKPCSLRVVADVSPDNVRSVR